MFLEVLEQLCLMIDICMSYLAQIVLTDFTGLALLSVPQGVQACTHQRRLMYITTCSKHPVYHVPHVSGSS